MIVDTGQVILHLLLLGMLDRVNLLLDALLNLPEHVVLPLLNSIVLVICLMDQDMDLSLGVLCYQELVDREEVLDRFLIGLLLHIDQVDDALGIDDLLQILGLRFLDVKVPWEVEEVESDVGADLLWVVLNLGSWVQHVLGLLRVHLLEDDPEDRGLARLREAEDAEVHSSV